MGGKGGEFAGIGLKLRNQYGLIFDRNKKLLALSIEKGL